mmetsp:Transcript_61057/g.162336  ORF Transcript_61057/g.162336 Transcript_61057/m.162336 type:complete len:156 (+) Transcript_61057:242-709(+)
MIARSAARLEQRDGVAPHTGWGDRRHLGVIIFSQKPAYRKASACEVPDVEVQVRNALLSAPMGYLHIHLPNMFPLRCFVAHILGMEMEPAGPFSLHPHPGHVQFLEIYVCALYTQLHRDSLYMKQRFLNTLPPWNLNQDMIARLHQVKTFAVDIC